MTSRDIQMLAVRYHQQDDGRLCGEATAQMVLGALGTQVEQAALGGELDPPPGEGTSPEELLLLLNSHRPADRPPFTLPYDRDPHVAVRRIVASLTAAPGLASAVPVLVFGGRHWVAVTGVVLDGGRASRSPAIHGLFIDNPLPPNPRIASGNKTAPPPHGGHDTCGLFLPNIKSQFGSGNTFVSMREWLHFYWRDPYPHDGDCTYVVLPPPESICPPFPGSIFLEPRAPLHGTGEMLKVEVLRAGFRGLRRYALTSAKSPLTAFLAGATANPQDVNLAEELLPDPNGVGSSEPYHLIRLHKEGHHVANVRLRARDGGVLSVQAPPAFVPGPSRLFDLALAALQRFEAESFVADDRRVTPERRFTVHPNLVWRPSRQTMSPFELFIQINVAGGHVYAGMDGRIYPNLDEKPIFRKESNGLTRVRTSSPAVPERSLDTDTGL